MDPQPPPDLAPTEDYWHALLEQGELAWRGRPDGPPPIGVPNGPGSLHPEPDGAGTDMAPDLDGFWSEMQAWMDEGVSFRAPVIGCNRGGLLVRVRERIGFLPASQLLQLPCAIGSDALREELEGLIGRELELRVIEVDPARNRVICSERATQWCDDEVESRLDELEAWIGREIEGTIRSVCDFGAFVDLDHIDGLIHISELSWQRVDHPSSVLSVGQDVRVRVLNVDRAARRVGLSLKRLQPDPWQLVEDRYSVGQVIEAVVTNVVEFGAFALVGEGVEGLVHISELADAPFSDPHEVVHEGQTVRVRVLSVDASAHRLGLSMRKV